MAGRPSGGRSPKRRRLSRSAEFERVYRQGRSKADRYLVLYAFPHAGDASSSAADEGPRLGLSVGRRVGGAVERSRVKRVLREAFWEEAERLPAGSDYVVVARPDSRDLAAREGKGGVRSARLTFVRSTAPPTRRETDRPRRGPSSSADAGSSPSRGNA